MKISITGHRPDEFLKSHYNFETVKRIIDDTVCVMKRTYGNELRFITGGAIGVDQWFAEACLDHSVQYEMYLPFLPKIQSKLWGDEDKALFNRLMKHSSGLTIIDPSGGYDSRGYQIRNIKMVDDSGFTIAFWVGRKSGGTFNCMKYALSQSKFVLHGLDGLKMIFNQDLKDGWRPGDQNDG